MIIISLCTKDVSDLADDEVHRCGHHADEACFLPILPNIRAMASVMEEARRAPTASARAVCCGSGGRQLWEERCETMTKAQSPTVMIAD